MAILKDFSVNVSQVNDLVEFASEILFIMIVDEEMHWMSEKEQEISDNVDLFASWRIEIKAERVGNDCETIDKVTH